MKIIFILLFILISLPAQSIYACGEVPVPEVPPVQSVTPRAAPQPRRDDPPKSEELAKATAHKRFGHMRAISRKLSMDISSMADDTIGRIKRASVVMKEKAKLLEEFRNTYEEILNFIQNGSLTITPESGEELDDEMTRRMIQDLATLTDMRTNGTDLTWIISNTLDLDPAEQNTHIPIRLKRSLLMQEMGALELDVRSVIQMALNGFRFTDKMVTGISKDRHRQLFLIDIVQLSELARDNSRAANWVAQQLISGNYREAMTELKSRLLIQALTRPIDERRAVSLALKGQPITKSMEDHVSTNLNDPAIISFLSNLRTLSERNEEEQAIVIAKRVLKPIGAAKDLSVQELLRQSLREFGFSAI